MRAIGQFTITNICDVVASETAPENPYVGQLWVDTSVSPPETKIWNGAEWVVQNDIETLRTTISILTTKSAELQSTIDGLNSYVGTMTETTVKGIDVSKWQGEIDWNKVKADGVKFAMIRLGYGSADGNSCGLDGYFEKNVANALNAGIDIGCYFYSYATSVAAAKKEAAYVVSVLQKYKGVFSYPVAFDLEDKTQQGLGKTVLTDMVIAFGDAIEKAGFYCSLYSNLNWLKNYLEDSKLKRFDHWLAQWASAPTYTGAFGMWQSSSTGKVSGINGNVDTDIAYKDYPTIIKNAKLNGFTGSGQAPTVPTQPDPQPTASFKKGDLVKIVCGECGNTFKRRIHSTTTHKYAAWCCNTHIENKDRCSMKYIRDDAVKAAFVTMINKLIFAHSMILKPYLEALRSGCKDAPLRRIQEIQTLLLENAEQRETLTKLMAQGYIDQILYNEENNTLLSQADRYRQEMDSLSKAIGGEGVYANATQDLLRYVGKAAMLTYFDEALFENTVDRIKVLSRREIAFELKCGLTLKERI